MEKSLIFPPDMLRNVSQVLDEARELLRKKFGKGILNELPDTFRTDAEAQKCWMQ